MNSHINSKTPSQFKYVAYIRIEVRNEIQYYHFYIENNKVTTRKPHIKTLDHIVTTPTINTYIKPAERTNDLLQKKIEKKIQDKHNQYNVTFNIINDEW